MNVNVTAALWKRWSPTLMSVTTVAEYFIGLAKPGAATPSPSAISEQMPKVFRRDA
jgi:hypothetical protein